MLRPVLIRLILASGLFVALPVCPDGVVGADPVPARVAELLQRMTREEKIGQLVLLTGYGRAPGPMREQAELERRLRAGECGNVFNVFGVPETRRLQEMAVKETRLGIPLLFAFDVVHGFRTIFPIPLGETASWNPVLMEGTARVAAVEASSAGLTWTFAPVVDIARDPRWGRIAEGAGEDPHLGSVAAAARVRGFQGAVPGSNDSLLACAKHFAAYGAVQAGRDYQVSDVSERTLREVHLPPFRAAVEAGVASVMTAFSELNGMPATANRFLLRGVLREEWGFPGFVVSDFNSIGELLDHGIAANHTEAGLKAFLAGVDMDMQGEVYLRQLGHLLEEGRIDAAGLDEAVVRVLTAKARLGLFEDPFRGIDAERESEVLLSAPHRELAYRAACESLVLLKNGKGILPLRPGARIAVIGPLADSKADLLGSWSGDGRIEETESLLSALRRADPSGVITHASGCGVVSEDREGFAGALATAKEADLVVMVLGESRDLSGEAKSRADVGLPGVQAELLGEVAALGKPVVLVLCNGRPLVLSGVEEHADAILEAWFPGTEGGRAVADSLFGRVNPSGKLPVTFPRHAGQIPIFHSVKNTGRPADPSQPRQEYRSNYLDVANDPLYPFGFGLSYTTFSLTDYQLDRDRIRPGGVCEARITVTNTGNRSGAEVVQLYVRDLVASVTRPLLELKDFRKVTLEPGASETVTFTLDEGDLAFLREDLTPGAEPGRFRIFVGTSSRDLQSADLELLPSAAENGGAP